MLNMGVFQESHTKTQIVKCTLKARLKRRTFSSFLKTRMSGSAGSARMCFGIEFYAAQSPCEKARSPNLVRSCGSEKSVDNTGFRR